MLQTVPPEEVLLDPRVFAPDDGGRASFFRELLRERFALLGIAFLGIVVLASIFAPFVAPHDPADQELADRLLPPAWAGGGDASHLLGTDSLGRDLLSRLIFGARGTLVIAFASVCLAGAFGTVLGFLAGFFGGRIDSLIMRAVDTMFAFPGLLLGMTMLAVLGPGTVSMIIVLSLLNWVVFARVIRGAVLSARQAPYIEALRIIGCRSRRIIVRHLGLHLASPVMTLLVLEFAHMVLAEASFSFLGLGVQPPETSWGLDVANGRDYIFTAWWTVTFPGLAIALTVLSANTVGSWARVISDPQERDKRHAAFVRRSPT